MTFIRSNKVQFYKQVQRDTLWSDPKDSLGNDYNSRGAGVAFGPDITKLFLQNNNLKMVIRSHECVRSGFDKPYSGWPEYEDILCTIFSASNYGGSGNTSAYIEIVLEDHISLRSMASSMIQRVADTNLAYTVHYFHVDATSRLMDSSFYVDNLEDNSSTAATDDDDANTVVDVEILASRSVGLNSVAGEEIVILPSMSPKQSDGRAMFSPTSQAKYEASMDQQATSTSPLSIPEQIFRKKMVLLDAFHSADVDRDGVIPVATWSDVMQHILKLKIQWASLLPALIQITSQSSSLRGVNANGQPSTPSSSSCLLQGEDNQPMINYFLFLNGFTSPKAFQFPSDADDGTNSTSGVSSTPNLDLNQAIVNALYTHYLHLEQTFQFFDLDKNGIITKDEFFSQCEIINTSLPVDHKLKDLDDVFRLMDVKGNGEIDINLFFEMFRLADNFANISDKLYTYHDTLSLSSAVPSTSLTRTLSASTSATKDVDSPTSAQYVSLPNSPVVLDPRLGPVVDFQRLVSVEENEHDDDIVPTSSKRTSNKVNPTVLERTVSFDANKRISLQNPSDSFARTNSFEFEEDESILVPMVGSTSPKPLSRHGSISTSPPPPPTSPPANSPKRRLSYQSVGESVDINGIRISIDAATPKPQEKKDTSTIVAIDI